MLMTGNAGFAHKSGESLFLRKLLWASLPNKRQKLRDRQCLRRPQPSCFTRCIPNKGYATSLSQWLDAISESLHFHYAKSAPWKHMHYRFWGLLDSCLAANAAKFLFRHLVNGFIFNTFFTKSAPMTALNLISLVYRALLDSILKRAQSKHYQHCIKYPD